MTLRDKLNSIATRVNDLFKLVKNIQEYVGIIGSSEDTITGRLDDLEKLMNSSRLIVDDLPIIGSEVNLDFLPVNSGNIYVKIYDRSGTYPLEVAEIESEDFTVDYSNGIITLSEDVASQFSDLHVKVIYMTRDLLVN